MDFGKLNPGSASSKRDIHDLLLADSMDPYERRPTAHSPVQCDKQSINSPAIRSPDAKVLRGSEADGNIDGRVEEPALPAVPALPTEAVMDEDAAEDLGLTSAEQGSQTFRPCGPCSCLASRSRRCCCIRSEITYPKLLEC